MIVPKVAKILGIIFASILLGLFVCVCMLMTGEAQEKEKINLPPSPVARYQEPSMKIEKNTCLPPQ